MATIHNLHAFDYEKVNRLLAESFVTQQPPGASRLNAKEIYESLKTKPLPEHFTGQIKYLVAAEGEELVGICVFYTYSDEFTFYANLRDLFVIPSFRRKGVGSALLEAMTQAKNEGCCLLIALPPPNSPEASQFLEKNGFQKGEHNPFVINL